MSDVTGVLNEADRVVGFCSHLTSPKPAKWGGKTRVDVENAVAEYMARKKTVRGRNGKTYLRKPRLDSRCLTTVIATYPIRFDEMTASAESREVFKEWGMAAILFITKELDGHLIAKCSHFDEQYPHFHFFAVGPCQHVHSGLKAEMVDGVLMKNRHDRVKAHRAALAEFQNRFYNEVSTKFGHQRKGDMPRGMRVKERELYFERKKLEEQARITGNHQTLRLFDEMYRLVRGSHIATATQHGNHPSDAQNSPDRPVQRD